MTKTLVVFDLNNILCFRVHRAKWRRDIPEDALCLGSSLHWTNPDAKPFIEGLMESGIDVGIWSSAYHANVLNSLTSILGESLRDKLRFIWSADHCLLLKNVTNKKNPYKPVMVKPIRRIRAHFGDSTWDKIILVDNDADKMAMNDDHEVVLMRPFFPYSNEQTDEELRCFDGMVKDGRYRVANTLIEVGNFVLL